MANSNNPFEELSSRLDRIEYILGQISNSKESSSDPDELLTLEEAAAFIKTPKKTIYQYTSQRVIPYIKSGRRLLFRKADLNNWLDAKAKHP